MRVFAGPNGSGKTTLVKSVMENIGADRIGVLVNADDIERELNRSNRLNLEPYGVNLTTESLQRFFEQSGMAKQHDPTALAKYSIDQGHILLNETLIDSYAAATLADVLRQKLLELRISFSFETVFSHESKIEFLQKAKTAGYRVYLYFVGTEDPLINIARVAERVRIGGHDVHKDKIMDRYVRGMNLLHSASSPAYRVYFFDNSRKPNVLFAERDPNGEIKYRVNEAMIPRREGKTRYTQHSSNGYCKQCAGSDIAYFELCRAGIFCVQGS
ncbi:MAG: zeta toxin family protein [Leptospirales bacterium]|nr:zeta toxin family protein [Leptospirales bacterium]